MKEVKIVISYKIDQSTSSILIIRPQKKISLILKIENLERKKKKKENMINRFISLDAEPTYLEKGIQ